MFSLFLQLTLMRMLWADLWPLSRGLGSHGAQLADLIATYAPRLLTPNELVQLAEQEIEAINDACARLVVICFFMMFNDLVCFALQAWVQDKVQTRLCHDFLTLRFVCDLVTIFKLGFRLDCKLGITLHR